MKQIVKLALILFIISAVAAGALGYVNAKTQGPIEASNRIASDEARKEILPEADNFEQMDIDNAEKYSVISEVYKGIAAGSTVGYTFKATPKGYSGAVEVLIGIGKDGVIKGVDIGANTETPGLGTKSDDDKFKGQYTGKYSILSVIKNGTPKENEIVAISGATITSKAVTSGVNQALQYYNDNLKNSN